MTVSYRGINYQEIALDDCLSLAQCLTKDGKHWHSHVLSPDCIQNPFAGVYALVIEDDHAQIPYIANSGTAFPEVDKDLVKMLHGADILDASKVASSSGTLHPSRLLTHLLALQADSVAWHHHMHFPSCAFNPHPGKWSISIESPEMLVAEAFGAEPVDLLRQIEVLYFDNLNQVNTAGTSPCPNVSPI
ncbi:MAG: hypothetical protein V4586_20580 [Pseudomonadota bacterium]